MDNCCVTLKRLAYLNEPMRHTKHGYPIWMGHSREFWQNMIHWRREWQTTSVNLPWEPHEMYQFSSVAQSCPILWDPMSQSTSGLLVHHQLPEFTQTHVQWVGKAIQPSHPLSFPSPPALNPSQHQGLFQWINSSHEVAKVLEFQFQHQSFQWTPRTDLL